jgi:peptidoglycan/xylan/chitin deacetylase (PgdA/CDA1 family)
MKKSITIDFEFDWGSRIKSYYAIEHTIDKILDIFYNNGAKGTFFISGETVDSCKTYIKKIYEANHEIASHGFNHNIKYDLLLKDELYQQIYKSKNEIENVIGEKIYGFRTPMFRKNKFTDEILKELGFTYDSSCVSVSLKHRYKSFQYCDRNVIKQVLVSNICGKLPAGIKWINIFGKHLKPNDLLIIYAHPFDFLTIKETLFLYDRNKIPLYVLLFYLARRENMLTTLSKVIRGSESVRTLI